MQGNADELARPDTSASSCGRARSSVTERRGGLKGRSPRPGASIHGTRSDTVMDDTLPGSGSFTRAPGKPRVAAKHASRNRVDQLGITMSLSPQADVTGDMPPQAARLAPKLRALADQDVYFGTSSWKYEGWASRFTQGIDTSPGASSPKPSSRKTA